MISFHQYVFKKIWSDNYYYPFSDSIIKTTNIDDKEDILNDKISHLVSKTLYFINNRDNYQFGKEFDAFVDKYSLKGLQNIKGK